MINQQRALHPDRRTYPYNMRFQDLKPEPGSDRTDPVSLIDEIRGLDFNHEELDRIFDAALSLCQAMILDPEYNDLSRGQILLRALDSAMTWERG